MLGGRVMVVGEAGRILTEAWGEGPEREPGGLERLGEAIEFEADEVEEALLCEMPDGCVRWMLRTEETEEEVDLRPPRPERRR